MRTCKKYANGQSRGDGYNPARKSPIKRYVKTDKEIVKLGVWPYQPKAKVRAKDKS